MIIKGKEPPQEAPQLGDMINMIASLGGYLGRKHDGPPGPKTLWMDFKEWQILLWLGECLRHGGIKFVYNDQNTNK